MTSSVGAGYACVIFLRVFPREDDAPCEIRAEAERIVPLLLIVYARIELPEHFSDVSISEGMTVQVTPRSNAYCGRRM
ncbi:hypothetical protein Poly30_20460 [Planctomycetes bacterium Poly30]|uniref:Uncharacterized protein n=1 Tax=Saltatorellus ferox TaxID=2528018 RepID=A0A518ER09_9BACT|nr:hypothetical protein Poly30_20460 [Planctomycetes bacterium Poly30]